MKRKVLNDGDVRWQGVETTKLSYDMIFREEEAKELNRQRYSRRGDGTGSADRSFGNSWHDDDIAEAEGEKLYSEEDVEALLAEKDREWSDRLEETCRKTYQLGLKEGEKVGREKTADELSRISRKLEEGFERAHQEWRERTRLLESGLLDLVFDIAEKVLKYPAERPEDRSYLDSEVGELMQRLDETLNPVLWVSEEDSVHLEQLKERVAPELPVVIRVSDSCKPGEYRLETDREVVVRDYRKMLEDFRLSLSLPSWRDQSQSSS